MFTRQTRVWIYAACVCAAFLVVVAMTAVHTCVPRDDTNVVYIQVGALRLEYVSERIMAMKACTDVRMLLPPTLLCLYIVILLLFFETQTEWQSELQIRPYTSVFSHVQQWLGIILLSVSAVGLFMVIIFDHTGAHRDWHGLGVALMLVGLAAVYMMTLIYESVYHLLMHSSRYTPLVSKLAAAAHGIIVLLFITSITLFVVAWSREHLSLAVLCEYILLLLIFLLALISMMELAVMPTPMGYKADHAPQHNAKPDGPGLPDLQDVADAVQQPLLRPGARDAYSTRAHALPTRPSLGSVGCVL